MPDDFSIYTYNLLMKSFLHLLHFWERSTYQFETMLSKIVLAVYSLYIVA